MGPSGEHRRTTVRPGFIQLPVGDEKQLAVETENWERIAAVIGRVLALEAKA